MQRELAEQLEIIRGQDEELAKDSIESRDLREQLERAYDREEELETRAEHAEAALAAMAG